MITLQNVVDAKTAEINSTFTHVYNSKMSSVPADLMPRQTEILYFQVVQSDDCSSEAAAVEQWTRRIDEFLKGKSRESVCWRIVPRIEMERDFHTMVYSRLAVWGAPPASSPANVEGGDHAT